MKYIYFGSSQFSCIILQELCGSGIKPLLIVSQPDRPKGRGLNLLPTEVSTFAAEHNVSLLKPEVLNDECVRKTIASLDPDFFIVADYGKILPQALISIPKVLALAIHPSLLPRYRGPAPINWALINCEEETGVTIFKMNELLDSGEIIAQKKISILSCDDAISLHTKLAHEGAQLLMETLERIRQRNFRLIEQDESLSTVAPKLKKEDGLIRWNMDASGIWCLIRGVSGWPCAHTYYKKKLIKILDAEALQESSENAPSAIVRIDKMGIYVATGGGLLKIKKLKPQDKKEMDAYSFVLGHRVKVGDRFE